MNSGSLTYIHQPLAQIRVAYEWTEDFVIKYLWSAAGYALISIPVMFSSTRNVGIQAPPLPGKGKDDAVADRTESAPPFHKPCLPSTDPRHFYRVHF